MNDLIAKEEPNLPALQDTVLPAITQLTQALDIPREALADNEEIQHAWQNLPRELKEIPAQLRNEPVARMCVAVSTGLFDAAINYVWNASILHLREKIRIFGLPVVAQTLQKDFEEKHLSEMQDSQLLELCLKLNIVDEGGFFFLDHCRNMRNNFSAAHPTLGKVNDRQFIAFLNSCVRYALADADSSPRGVNISDFISAIKGDRFNAEQLNIWRDRLLQTHSTQRQMLITMAHGFYCDPNAPEPSRLNSLDICEGLTEELTASMRSELINNHSEYGAKGLQDKRTASLQFFEELGLVSLLDESEQHTLFSRAVQTLWNVHNGMNNFYNEPAFAERLLELSQQGATPETVKEEYVQTIACCRIGNGYGVSRAAVGYYDKMIQSFSPREIFLLLQSADENSNKLGRRIHDGGSYLTNFKTLLGLIDSGSVPTAVREKYTSYLPPNS